jgi:hypothetical protein
MSLLGSSSKANTTAPETTISKNRITLKNRKMETEMFRRTSAVSILSTRAGLRPSMWTTCRFPPLRKADRGPLSSSSSQT